jgi:hypothetical protein
MNSMTIWLREPEFEAEGQRPCDLCGRYWFDDDLEDEVCIECREDINDEQEENQNDHDHQS